LGAALNGGRNHYALDVFERRTLGREAQGVSEAVLLDALRDPIGSVGGLEVNPVSVEQARERNLLTLLGEQLPEHLPWVSVEFHLPSG
jgi:hypothetical protein